MKPCTENLDAHSHILVLFYGLNIELQKSSCEERCAVYDALLREGGGGGGGGGGGQEVAMSPIESQLIAVGEHGC